MNFIIGGLVGGIGFIITFLIGKNLIISLVIGIALFVVMGILFDKKKEEPIKTIKDDSIPFDDLIKLYELNFDIISAHAKTFDGELLEVVNKFIINMEKLINVVKKNPDKKEKSEQYLNQYISKFVDLSKVFSDMKNNNIDNRESKGFEKELINFTKMISKSTEEVTANFYREDIFESLVSMKVMETGLKSSGIYKYIEVDKEDFHESKN